MTAGLVTEYKKYANLAKKSQLKGTYGTPWTLVGQDGGPRQGGIGFLLVEEGEEGPESYRKE